MDAIDSALVQFKKDQIALVEYQQYPIDRKIRNRLQSITKDTPLKEIAHLDVRLGMLFADAVKTLIRKADINPNMVTAIGSHGQTVIHNPDAPEPFSLQIADPNIIAMQTGITTVADFRRMDIAAGGKGAPLAPAFHACQFRSRDKNRVILNIGGIANITILPSDISLNVSGFDTGPGNALLDAWINQHKGSDMDTNGTWAGSGKVDNELLQHLLGDPFFAERPPKSTGRDLFNPGWLNNRLASLERDISPEDVQATLVELTTQSIKNAINKHTNNIDEMYVCGGGVHNTFLMERLGKLLPNVAISSIEAIGVNPDAVEAMTFAWLAKCRLETVTANLPSVTGAKQKVILGGVFQAR
jgi:anhydro-N-acetylmuramic acid kinase